MYSSTIQFRCCWTKGRTFIKTVWQAEHKSRTHTIITTNSNYYKTHRVTVDVDNTQIVHLIYAFRLFCVAQPFFMFILCLCVFLLMRWVHGCVIKAHKSIRQPADGTFWADGTFLRNIKLEICLLARLVSFVDDYMQLGTVHFSTRIVGCELCTINIHVHGIFVCVCVENSRSSGAR